jgi:hypothetical protein
VFRTRHQGLARRVLAILLAAAIAGCTAPPPAPTNPFLGTWSTPDSATILIRQDTVVQNQPDGQSVALDRNSCNGRFSFTYTVWHREALAALLPRQPNLDKNLSALLAAPTYPVALLRCDHGDHTYVLLNDHEIVAIYRDGDIGVVEHLARR